MVDNKKLFERMVDIRYNNIDTYRWNFGVFIGWLVGVYHTKSFLVSWEYLV